MSKVCVVGHITSESILMGGNRLGPTVGGTGFFSSLAYRKLGLDTTLVTKIADNDREHLLSEIEHAGVMIRCLRSPKTLQFENIYPSSDPNLRQQRISSLADPLTTDDLVNVFADVFHLGPLAAGDIEPALFTELRTRGTVALDVQGLLRVRRSGKVVLKMSPSIRSLVQQAHILKADTVEARLLTGCNSTQDALTELQSWGPNEILITDGSRGSSICSAEGMREVPAYTPTKATNPTGCGDTYLAGYVAARLQGLPPYQSAHIGAVAASHKLEYTGPLQASFGELSKQIGREFEAAKSRTTTLHQRKS
jgi:sugar/nucleoside kinase (ribokinase family)